jgi:hypothetical protein
MRSSGDYLLLVLLCHCILVLHYSRHPIAFSSTQTTRAFRICNNVAYALASRECVMLQWLSVVHGSSERYRCWYTTPLRNPLTLKGRKGTYQITLTLVSTQLHSRSQLRSHTEDRTTPSS